jgi:aminoglycoside phosphotransferase (APT) family kinase protein
MPAKPIDEQDLRQRTEALLEKVAPGCQIDAINPLQGGSSSITYWTTFRPVDGTVEKVVLKVAPAGLDPVKNRDVLRQARVLRAVQPTGVPVPRVLASHEGDPPDIPPFFIMSFENGDCVEPNSLPPGSLTADEVHHRELHAAGVLGALHRLDPAEIGLGDEPETTLEAEVDRWTNSFASCDEDLREGTEDVGRALAANVPPMGPTALLHGDFRLGNTLSQGQRVESVIDWEIWARGDARVDLAWFLMMANPDPDLGRHTAAGMPPNSDLLATYHAARGVEVSDLDWFAALVRYKQAAAGALITRNARRRGHPVSAASGNPGLLISARRLLGIKLDS